MLGSPCPRESVDLAALSTSSTSLHINGTQFTCFTGTKVQILTLQSSRSGGSFGLHRKCSRSVLLLEKYFCASKASNLVPVNQVKEPGEARHAAVALLIEKFSH